MSPRSKVLTPKDTLSLAYSVLTENQKKRFETEDELDFSFGIQNLARFRGNVFKQRGLRGDGDPHDSLQRADRSRSWGCRRSSPSWPSGRGA